MEETFELADPEAAQEFLRALSAEVRRRGQSRYQSGAVEELRMVKPGNFYRAVVADTAWKNEVDLYYDPTEGWDANCSCPLGFDCVHIHAAMSALLAEHRTGLVRQLSKALPVGTAGKPSARNKPAPVENESLAERLSVLTGSALGKEAKQFLLRLHGLYRSCCQTRELNNWQLQGLGFPVAYEWGALQIWPVFPKTELEFWLYLAHHLIEKNIRIPDFMQPLTDLSVIAQPLARWKRALEIEKWNRMFANHPPSSRPSFETKEVDLRLVLEADVARLQWQRPGRADFETLKQGQFRQLESDYAEGLVSLKPEAELLWQLFSNALEYGCKLELESANPAVEQALNRLLRAPALASRIVLPNGQALVRPPEPLSWQLTPAENEEDDYRVRLVQADGSPVPPVLCVLPGCPALYLAEGAVFAGPDPMEKLLDTSEENRIPAPALEQPSGLAFLQVLGVELPPRLRDRVRRIPLKLRLECRLVPAYKGSDAEDCLVSAEAVAEDGLRLAWDQYGGWSQKKAPSRRKREAEAVILFYDEAVLKEFPALLEPLGAKPSAGRQGFVVKVSKKFAENFVQWRQSLPPNIEVDLDAELASLTAGNVAGRVKLEVTEREIDWFDLQVVLDVDDTTLTRAEIKLLLNAKGGFVRLRGKGWRRLQYDLSDEENERLARLGLSARELSAEPQRMHALQLADDAAKKFLPEPQVEQIQRRVSEIKARVAPPLPGGVTAQLRPYQLDGFHFLAYLSSNRFGGILADDMGLGKTLQTLSWLIWLREQDTAQPGAASGSKPSLVVCPKSVMDNWQAEVARFAPGLRVKVWSAGEVAQLRDQLDSADIHVLNYSQLRFLGESLAQVQWLAVILDEGQYIKNPSSQTAQVARTLKASHRLVLTGTPIENRLLDLWSLMAFAMPGVLGSRNQFARLYDAKGDPLARRRLAARVRPFLLRRTKAQVAQDLPDRIEEDLFCEIEGEQQALYRVELKAAQQLLLSIKTQKELAQNQFHFLTSLLRLRQICCHPRLVMANSTAASAKTESLLDQLEPLMEEGQKVLVFSQFVTMLDLLRPLLEGRNWPVWYLAGQTENRGDLVRDFQAHEGPGIFLISLKAGGFGLNLTAASYVVLFDPWWNPAVENQAIDRTHRIGQTNKVIAYRLLIKNSIEEKIRALQKQKRALIEDVLGEEKFAQSLTLDDLKFLFAD